MARINKIVSAINEELHFNKNNPRELHSMFITLQELTAKVSNAEFEAKQKSWKDNNLGGGRS